MQDLRERGLAHERAYLDQLRAEGRTLAGAEEGTILTVEATLAAMRSGIDVIYQAALEHDAWFGRADFLLKVNDAPSRLGAWSYEACDTKLARETKAGTILQLCTYAELLQPLQGVESERFRVITPLRQETYWDRTDAVRRLLPARARPIAEKQ